MAPLISSNYVMANKFTTLADKLSTLARLDQKTIDWREQFVNKRPAPIKPLLPGTKVFLVNGKAMRDLFDSDWVEAGNGERYDFIPKNEYWIDDTMDPAERYECLVHETIESLYMMAGLDYNHAHDKAKAVEDKIRHKQLPQGELDPPVIH